MKLTKKEIIQMTEKILNRFKELLEDFREDIKLLVNYNVVSSAELSDNKVLYILEHSFTKELVNVEITVPIDKEEDIKLK